MVFSFFKKRKKTPETEPVSEKNRPQEEPSSPEPSLQPDIGPDLRSDESKKAKDFVGEKPVLPGESAMDKAPAKEPEPGIEPDIDQQNVQTEEPVQKKPEINEGTGLLSKLKSGLAKTRTVLNTDVTELFSSAKSIDDDLFDNLEERLVTSDLGIDITMDMMARIKKKSRGLSTADQLRQVLKDELLTLFHEPGPPAPSIPTPYVIMMVGVNGTGKTTTLGKLAMKYKAEGKKVLIAAADTFRAAAIEQVEIWARRAGADIVRHKEGADPAAVAYDAVEAGMARGADVVLIDTAGRLHTQKNLMEELKKIKRSVDKKYKGAPHDVMMVIDATTGQNALSQADIFHKAVGLTQMSVTKLDGTAKGGIVAAVSSTMKLPIAYIGVGEAIEDLQEFDAKRFIDALFDD
ncbi:signal recognition particle-docking protein FtsY [Desulfobacter hydrogenophilus]|uniref:Signal recognition particle receptor FtsY n=1 Tax=Desulfobacter hydrogenophilus TaxID=2291 RepID=A0A328FJM7_9BACT|nr:signal recognition particle-docking protein FtsY [Desulfobacter hydrogenophilus]QBH13450.1 signal recognition particle-docking protein FtsY [Desulfobacter hydrogenophilus]RAM03702.1 signal recognition particle-docking protein FtsY [Desulfobacter hydrogenophilus]